MSENAQRDDHRVWPPEEPTARASLLLGPLHQFAKEAPEKLPLIAAHLSPQVRGGDAEALVSVGTFLEGLARMERSARDPAFAVRAGLSQDLTDLGLLGHACACSERLWDALQIVRDALNYIQEGCRIVFGMRLNRFRIDYSNAYGAHAEAAYEIQNSMALLMTLIRQTKGYREANLVVRFPRCRTEHRDLLPDADRVSSASRGIVEFDAVLLRRPMVRSNPALAATIERTMSVWVGQEPSAVDLVRSLQDAALHEIHRPLPLTTLSLLLSKPPRSLQFELRKSGNSFAGIRDDARHRAAKADLSAGRSVTETAHRLGYAQHQSFSEAFTRWEGLAPSVFASRGK